VKSSSLDTATRDNLRRRAQAGHLQQAQRQESLRHGASPASQTQSINQSINSLNNKPRIHQTQQQAQKMFPRLRLGTEAAHCAVNHLSPHSTRCSHHRLAAPSDPRTGVRMRGWRFSTSTQIIPWSCTDDTFSYHGDT
jgi:hypothetical protein